MAEPQDDLVVYTDAEMAEARERFVKLYGPRVPEGMTAGRLRGIAEVIKTADPNYDWESVRHLLAWADALERGYG
jgi:hypothetical protein